MMPTADIIAIAVESAPTSTAVRRSDPARLREASSASTPNKRPRSRPDSTRQSGDQCRDRQRRGADQQDRRKIPEQRLASDGRPLRREPGREPREHAAKPRSRHLCMRTSCSRRPRAIASTGTTCDASHAGSERGEHRYQRLRSPTQASATLQVIAIGAGVLQTYSDSTVAATSCTAPTAIRRPSATPAMPPGEPEADGLPRNAPSTAATCRAQRAHDADLRPPPHHRNRNRVVDQKRADHQRDVAQHPQIPAERGQHAPVLSVRAPCVARVTPAGRARPQEPADLLGRRRNGVPTMIGTGAAVRGFVIRKELDRHDRKIRQTRR